MLRSVFLAVLAGLCIGRPVAAQSQADHVHWHLMGGYSEPIGVTGDYLQGGYLVGGGFTVAPSPNGPLDFRFDVTYSDHNASNNLLLAGQQATNLPVDNGSGSFWAGTANVEYRVPIVYDFKIYGIAGVGVYHEHVELTQALPYGYYYCDPFYGYCDAGGAGAVVASNGITKFGWNAGLGFEFPLSYGRSWFLEARYHRISTQKPIEFVPIEIGYRF